jgi:hypothetical protein
MAQKPTLRHPRARLPIPWLCIVSGQGGTGRLARRRHGAVGIPLRGLEGNRPIDDPDFYVFPKLRFGCFEVGSSWLTYVVTQQLRILSANAEALFGPGWRRGRPYRNLHSRISASHPGRGFDARLSRVQS